VLTTDASGYAIGGILSQGPIGKDKPIAYTSRVLNECEQKYHTYEKEALAIVYSVLHFRPYLYGHKFTLVTDHKPLVWFQKSTSPDSRVTKWRLKLLEYDFDVVYKAGKMNVNADALSRNPVKGRDIAQAVIYEREKDIPLEGNDDEPFIEELLETPIHSEVQAEVYATPIRQIRGVQARDPPRRSPRLRQRAVWGGEVEEPELPGSGIGTPPVNQRKRGRPRKEPPEHAESRNPSVIPRKRGRPKKGPTECIEPADLNRIDQIDEDGNILEETTTEFVESEELDSEGDFQEETQNLEIDDTNSEDGKRFEQETLAEDRTLALNIIKVRDQLWMRKDNYAYFVRTNGDPCDKGSEKLAERGEIPNLGELCIGQAKAIRKHNTYHIALPIVTEDGENLTEVLQNIKEVTLSFRETVNKLQLRSVSMARSVDVANILWEEVMNQLRQTFSTSTVKIIICQGIIQYVPINERQEVIKENHSSAVGGHKGVTKTYKRIRQRYYWGTLKSDVQKFIQNCLGCQLKKLVRVKTRAPMIITDTPGATFDKISMDIVGPLPRTKNGNEYILTIQDNLSKLSVAIPLPNALAATIADAFVKRFICIFGAPRAVLTDQGRNFLSDLLRKLAKRFRIKQFKTTAFHPQSNGSLERSHHVLGEYLKQFISKDAEWDDWVELAMFSYNTSVHEGTNHTPYELVYGRLARLPSSEPFHKGEAITTYDDYLINLASRLHTIQSLARETLVKSKFTSKKHYDKRVNPLTFGVGDYVFLLKGPKPGKFGDQYTGPHKVLEILSKGNVRIQLKKNTKVVHINRLKYSHIIQGKAPEGWLFQDHEPTHVLGGEGEPNRTSRK
jgi:His(2)-Cys(2) zinc finger./Integrase core domain.